MPRPTNFPTVPLDRIRHLIAQAEILDAEEAMAVCLTCGHPESDHSIENETCWHSMAQNGKVKICDCHGWRQGLLSAGAAD